MSTPTTGTSEENAGVPARLRRRDTGWRARVRRRNSRTQPPGSLPRPSTVEPDAVRAGERSALLAHARGRGVAAARQGVVDCWVLSGGDRVPYFAELASLRDRVRERMVEEDARAEEDARLAMARLRTDGIAANRRIQRTEQRRTALRERLVRTASQLDRLAQRADRWETFRDTVREGLEHRWLRARLTALGNGTAQETANRLTDDDLTAGEAVQTGRAVQVSAAWEGELPHSGMGRWGRWFLLGLLGAVELPVYYVVFENLHGVGPFAKLLSGSLTVATAVVMILAPHVVGRVLRRRGATGAVRLAAVPAVVFLAAWGYAAWALGTLRAKLVFRAPKPITLPEDLPRSLVPNDLQHPQSIVDTLHLSTQSVTLMFVTLLLLSGGVAFLLGLAEEHPYLAAYRSTRERLARLDHAQAADEECAVFAKEAEEQLEGRLAERRVARDARLNAVDDLYEAAAHAYLDGLAEGAADPAMTEAVMRLGQQWPLLPERDAHRTHHVYGQGTP